MEKSKSWLADHLEQFVVPYLGHFPAPFTRPRWDASDPVQDNYFTPAEMAILKASWRSAKKAARGHTIGLFGRDVWVYEVLARRENYPTDFRPECSRQTAHLLRTNYTKPVPRFLLDTGFVGSIPRALGIKEYTLLSANRPSIWYSIYTFDFAEKPPPNRQVFPNLRGARSLALKVEATPKYWTSAISNYGVIKQELSSLAEFERAAALTIQIYKDSSPRHVPRAPLPKWYASGEE